MHSLHILTVVFLNTIRQQEQKNDPNGPDIGLKAIRLSVGDFGSHRAFRAEARMNGDLSHRYFFGEAKVTNFNEAVMDEDVG